MDDMYNLMENEEAWIAPYYAGDAMLMMDANPDLAFYLPEEETFNVFIDAMCIPASAEHKEEAELFINFLREPGDLRRQHGLHRLRHARLRGQGAHGPRDGEQPRRLSRTSETLARGEAFVALSDEATAAHGQPLQRGKGRT